MSFASIISTLVSVAHEGAGRFRSKDSRSRYSSAGLFAEVLASGNALKQALADAGWRVTGPVSPQDWRRRHSEVGRAQERYTKAVEAWQQGFREENIC